MPNWPKIYILKLNVDSLITYFITKRESCFEFMYFTDRLLMECKYTNFRILCKLTFDPYSEQIGSMSNGNAQISSLGVRRFQALLFRDRTYMMRHYSNSFSWRKSFCSPYSAQLRCMSLVIIRISSLVVSNVSRLMCISLAIDTMPLNEFHYF